MLRLAHNVSAHCSLAACYEDTEVIIGSKDSFWNIYIFGQEMLGLAPTYDIDIEKFGGKWCQNLMQ